MKLDGFPDCIEVHATDMPGGRIEARASLMLHAIAIDEITPDDGVAQAVDKGREACKRAAESVLSLAGLHAAVYYGADIMPFLQLGQAFKRGDTIGRVVALVNAPNDCYVAIHWDGSPLDSHADVDPDDIADDLRAGVMVLA